MISEYEKELLKITESEDVEATAYPIWFILDPTQMMKPDCFHLASMISGPFFSRKSATETLKSTRYNYGKHAVVYCASGTDSREWRDLYNSSMKLRKEIK